MRKIYPFFALAMILSCASVSISNADNTTNHNEKTHVDLVGKIDQSALLEAPYRTWYTKNHSSYSPDKGSLDAIAKTLSDIQIKVFMGTWCHDSQREVPRLYKILESSDFDLNNLNLVALNSEKMTPTGLENGLKIEKTPTFIFFKDGVELGRIVETPRDSLEGDILKIISGQDYKHSYQQ